MKLLSRVCALIVVTCIVSPSRASFVFFRSMPPEGTWAEWQIRSDLFSPDVKPKIRLTAGKVIQREQRRFQTLELSGIWEDNQKPVKLKASYEVDLDGLEKNGYPAGVARLLTAYKEVNGEMQAIKAGDPLLGSYELMLCLLTDVKIEPETVRLDEPADLQKYKLKLLKARVGTKHFAEGEAPTSDFQAWISDEVPFGVAKWVMRTELSLDGKRTAIVQTATLIGWGNAVSATTSPGGAPTTTAPIENGRTVLEPAPNVDRRAVPERGRGRTAGCPAAPAQTPAGGTTAPGSYLRSDAQSRCWIRMVDSWSR